MEWQTSKKDTHSEIERDRIRKELKAIGFELTDLYGQCWEYTNDKLKIKVILTAREG